MNSPLVMTVVGARPQFVKAATVSRAMAALGRGCEIIVHTGQHYDVSMSDVFFEELEIPHPHHNLGIGSGSHGAMTGRQLEAIEGVIKRERPDLVLVYGDTNSTLAGALAAAKLNIPVAHVEAGLRSFNRRMPEEINRILTDHISSLLFAPTSTAVRNLAREGIADERVSHAGDVMYDATMFYRSRARKPAWFDDLNLALQDFVLCTIHRAENTDDRSRLRGILAGLGKAERPVVLPLHPRTRTVIESNAISVPANVCLADPVGYLEMTWLEMNCAVIATDSGGVQKEAYFHRKHCVTLRDETEWVELIESGANVLAGSDPEKIEHAIRDCRSRPWSATADEYGDGAAAGRIARAVHDFFIAR